MARDERIKHIELIKTGVPGYALIKIAKDVKAMPRKMMEFNSEYLICVKNNFRLTKEGVLQVELGGKYTI